MDLRLGLMPVRGWSIARVKSIFAVSSPKSSKEEMRLSEGLSAVVGHGVVESEMRDIMESE
jgi:hypothetical protein